ncbi:MAG: hypothetical protein FWE48_02945 [Coriobacteriia bacterium]|nr:hypothetical protein [Coriobacteriia bacterium]MCL2870353.1 hypothetical protein [Coriobacteriia bacterium]
MPKTLKSRVVLVLATLLLAVGVIATAAWALDPSLDGLTIETGGPASEFTSGSLVTPSLTTLSEGEVLVGKSVVYNTDPILGTPDGTVTVTLSAWASTFTDADGVVQNPLVPMADGAYLTITDDINEFAVVGSLPAGLSISGATITWDITDQSTLLGVGPLEVQYTLTVANPANQPYMMNYWYSTGAAEVLFEPHHENPYYYTMVETVYDQFDMSMNWNNGTGLNNGAIIDNELGLTIVFPSNISAAGLNAYNADGTMNTAGQWNWWPQNANTQNQAATVVTPAGTQHYTWHLHWTRGAIVKSYIFTIKDFLGPGLDVQYEAILDGAGGSGSIAGGKTVVSDTYFQRTFNSDQDDPFFWTGDTISKELDAIGEVMLVDQSVPPTFQLAIEKAFGTGSTHLDWDIDDSSEFVFSMQDDTTGLYLAFIDMGGGELAFNGYTARQVLIPFSVDAPVILTDIPTEDTEGNQKTYAITEYPNWTTISVHPPQVDVEYSVDGSATASNPATIEPQGSDESTVTVTNTFTNMPVAAMRLMKLFDGFPADWGITSSTEFQVKIWDVDNEVYLLFVEPDAASLAPGSSWDSSYWSPGTLFCVGNDGGASGAWDISDSYWEQRHLAGTADIFDTISIYRLQQVGLTNIWPSQYEIHELDFEGNLLATSPASSWWQAYYNFVSLDRAGGPGDPGTIAPGGNYVVLVTNVFQHGEGNLSLFKELEGYPEDWDVSDETSFTVRVWDAAVSPSVRLLFDPVRQSDGTFRHVGFIDAGGQRILDDLSWTGDLATAIYDLTFSVNSPLVVSNLYTGTNHQYLVEELVGDGYTTRFFNGGQEIIATDPSSGAIISPDDAANIRVVNTFERAPVDPPVPPLPPRPEPGPDDPDPPHPGPGPDRPPVNGGDNRDDGGSGNNGSFVDGGSDDEASDEGTAASRGPATGDAGSIEFWRALVVGALLVVVAVIVVYVKDRKKSPSCGL